MDLRRAEAVSEGGHLFAAVDDLPLNLPGREVLAELTERRAVVCALSILAVAVRAAAGCEQFRTFAFGIRARRCG